MNLCEDGHDEVCFESRDCPVCNLKEEMQTEIDELQLKLYNAENDN